LFYYLIFSFSYFYYFLLVLSPVLHAGRRRQASSRNDAKLRSREQERERREERALARNTLDFSACLQAIFWSFEKFFL
jgi:hypothetical protein